MNGRTALVTGGSSGIGLAAATAIAASGATTFLVGRDRVRVDWAVARVAAGSGNADVHGLVADLSSQAEVRRLADAYAARHDTLDVLVNNAGAGFARHTLSADGIECTWALNHLAPFLLTHLLLPQLARAVQGRVITVSSSSHRGARLHLDDDLRADGYRAGAAYGRSKLANLLFTYGLSRRLRAGPATPVTANATDPGAVATNLFRSETMATAREPGLRLGMLVHRMVARSPQHGATGIVHLATSSDVALMTGTYWRGTHQVRSSRDAQDVALQDKLWEHSLRATGLPAAQRPGGALTT